ncbi:antitoxin ParD1/3/4 [Sphingomonas jinjuensis]|uniref:Antitoxin ParD1/3/4 n=1 Tax=Sphingomonas jinjuensis TaxID=535907 RepID=A0A840FAV0_9SPHN|nr:type II toxin-antitoxin system ParD family antitoxin [Sphingomonas jinjuensis]MBB4154789.1 antitoxin ParD1/3/4 [Sphingomonas jinjuensis]
MSDLIISIPPALQSWVDHQVALGLHADAADYVRDLIRRERERAERSDLRLLIEDGLASGVDPREPELIVDAILAEDPDFRA